VVVYKNNITINIQKFISLFCIITANNRQNKINVSIFTLFLKIYILLQSNNFLKWIIRTEDIHNYDFLLELEILKILTNLTGYTIILDIKNNKKYFCYIKWKMF
jgi:hypothetical protein